MSKVRTAVISVSSALTLVLGGIPLQAHSTSQTVRGGTGLVQTPTARMEPEGELNLSYTDIDQYRFWTVSLQLFPWMESTVRYTDVRTQLYSADPNFSGNQTLKDKGIDVKFRLLEESYYLPDVSVGFMDIGGTGFFRSEYINASKAIGPFDFHLGLGWGYLGTHNDFTNPFCEVRDSFCSRPGGFSGLGGKIDYDQFYRGDVALFGGIEYQTPIEGLSLKLEYEGNNYINDRAGTLEQDTRWNLGATYSWNNWDFSLNYQRGNTVGFGVSYSFNLDTASQIRIDREPRSLDKIEPALSMDTLNRERLYQDLYYQGNFLILATHQGQDSFTIYGLQSAYNDYNEATQRVGRIMASELPESITQYNIVDVNASVPLLETQIDARQFKAEVRDEVLEKNIESSYVRVDPSQETVDNYKPRELSGPLLSAETFFIQTFGNPEDFYLYQGGLIVNTGYVFDGKFSVRAAAKVNIFENFDKFNFTTDNQPSALPRVRTQVREYVSGQTVTMENAYLHWFDRIGEDMYAQAYAGYLETMFGGVGGEFMYRPVDSNFAFGVDLNYVKQRSFENTLDFFDYSTFTGHASVYWTPEQLPDLQLSISAGQFLAGDKGVNIDFAKRFDSGVIVGAYAAFTNVSAEEYGEGSFTKGFYVSIPFDLLSYTPAKGRGKLPWIPIARDGGQMLQRPVKLKNLTELRSPFYD